MTAPVRTREQSVEDTKRVRTEGNELVIDLQGLSPNIRTLITERMEALFADIDDVSTEAKA
jgi:hypothetical protein